METITTTSMGETDTETVENAYIYKVEKIEEITVPAGTLKCFKIVKYDEAGNITLSTSWQSDKVKPYEVKGIDHQAGGLSELKSHSLK